MIHLRSALDAHTLSSEELYFTAKYLLDHRDDQHSTMLANITTLYLSALDERDNDEAKAYYRLLKTDFENREMVQAPKPNRHFAKIRQRLCSLF